MLRPHPQQEGKGTMPRRSIWGGSIVFGMTSIPIKMYAALDTERSEMHTYHTTCSQRVTMPKVCTTCETEVLPINLSSGIDYTHGRTILFSREELDAFKPQADHMLSITQFCPDSDVDPALFEKVHYIMSTGDAFASLHHAMFEKGVLAIGRVVLHSKEHLVALRAVPGGMLCHTLHWPEMLREPEWDDLSAPFMLDQARSLVARLTGSFVPAEYKDEQRAGVEAFIDQRKNELDA